MRRSPTHASGKRSAAVEPPTLEALVAVCNGEGALLHGQLVKFSELLPTIEGGKNSKTEKKKIQLGKNPYDPSLKCCNSPFVCT